MEKTFTDCLKQIIDGCGTPPNFAEKTFADGYQTSKSTKIFSLESFPLYGKQLKMAYIYTTMANKRLVIFMLLLGPFFYLTVQYDKL